MQAKKFIIYTWILFYISKNFESLSIYLSICLSVYLSVCVSVCLSVCLSINLSEAINPCMVQRALSQQP